MAEKKDREEESKRLEEKNKDVEEKSRDVKDEETGQVISLEEDGRKQQASKLGYVMRIGQIIERSMFSKDCTEDLLKRLDCRLQRECNEKCTALSTGLSIGLVQVQRVALKTRKTTGLSTFFRSEVNTLVSRRL